MANSDDLAVKTVSRTRQEISGALLLTTPPAGLRVLESNARIELLITDVGLPNGMNGRQVADAARVTRPDLKVLFITGYAENSLMARGRMDNGMHILTKPFQMDIFAEKIRQIIEER